MEGYNRGGPRRNFRPRRRYCPECGENCQGHNATCSECGEKCKVPFPPDKDKEVYCKECYMKRKRAA